MRISICQAWRASRNGERDTFAAHSNGVGYTNSIVLPAEHTLLLNCILDYLGKVEHYKIQPHMVRQNFLQLARSHLIATKLGFTCHKIKLTVHAIALN